jgi:hypothetical protein
LLSFPFLSFPFIVYSDTHLLSDVSGGGSTQRAPGTPEHGNFGGNHDAPSSPSVSIDDLLIPPLDGDLDVDLENDFGLIDADLFRMDGTLLGGAPVQVESI